MRRAIERGLTTADFETMTIGMVIDYLVTCQNDDNEQEKREKNTRRATVADIEAF